MIGFCSCLDEVYKSKAKSQTADVFDFQLKAKEAK